MRWDVLTRHTSLLFVFLSISLANPLFTGDFAQAPFEIVAANPALGIANPNAFNFGISVATFGTESAALDSSPANDQVILADGVKQQILPQRKKDDSLPPSWTRKEVGPGRGAPKPSNPNIPEGAWGRYPGYPNENTNLDDMYELDPNTRERLRFKPQLRWHCDEGLSLLCCRPLLILCYPCELVPVSLLSSSQVTSLSDGTLKLGSQSQELTWFAPATFSPRKRARMHPRSAKML